MTWNLPALDNPSRVGSTLEWISLPMTAQPPPVQARPADKTRQDQTGKEERSDDVVYLEKNLSRKNLSNWCEHELGVKVPILQVVISFRMKLWPVAHFFSLTFGIMEHTKHCSMSFLYSSTRNDMPQCFVCSPIPKVSEKNEQPVRVSFRKKLLLA